MLGGSDGLMTAAVIGGDSVEVPRSLVRGALERKESGRARGVLCAPLIASGGAPFGILYAERLEPFLEEEQRTVAALGRLAGEAFTAVRARADAHTQPVVLIGSSRQFRKTVESARRCASSAEPTVIAGEPGTGRAQMARYIHSRSPRALGPFITVDCRRSPVEVEELLFGRTSSPGVPPQSSALLKADGGSLLLQCVESLPRHLSARLARFITNQVAPARQGGEEKVDVRFLVTARWPLEELESRGEIDLELAKALQGLDVESIAVRDRRPDVLQLFEHFSGEVAKRSRREPPTLSPDARRLLVDSDWPGNVGELRGVAERLTLLYAGAEVSALKLPPEIQEGPQTERQSLAQRVTRLERVAISEALREAKGKKIRAAAILGISRPTLDKKIEEFSLVVEKRRS